MNTLAEQLLEEVKKSPAAVGVHDKQAWMSIFANYHAVEDPVGSSPHVGGLYDATEGKRGHGALDRFYDTFIAPNEIKFDVKRDIVCGNHVVRDLTINLNMSPTVSASVPMHLLYELVQEGEEWKIVRLAAHWELVPMVTQLLSKGIASFGVLGSLTARMIKFQGFAGIIGFSKAAINIGNSGKTQLNAFVAAFNNKDASGLLTQDVKDSPYILAPFGEAPLSASAFLEKLKGELSIEKILAAGDTVSASFQLKQEERIISGVILAEFNKGSKKISQIKFYYNEA